MGARRLAFLFITSLVLLLSVLNSALPSRADDEPFAQLFNDLGSVFVSDVRSTDVWRHVPDPSVPLPSERWHAMNSTSRQQLLTRLGIPFIIDIGDTWSVESVVDALLLMHSPGLCLAHPDASTKHLFLLLHPGIRSYWYSEERAVELRRYFAVSPLYDIVMNGKFESYQPHVAKAEEELLRMPDDEAETPGTLPISFLSFPLFSIPLLDIGVEWEADASIAENASINSNLQPSLNMNILNVPQRLAERQRLKQKYHYMQGVHKLDSILQNANAASGLAFRVAAAAYNRTEATKLRRRKMIRALRDEQARRKEAQKLERKERGIEMKKKAAEQRKRDQDFRRRVVCDQLRRVSDTLRVSQVSPSTQDHRYLLHDELVNKYNCSVSSGEGEEGADTPFTIPPSVVPHACEHVHQFKRWNNEMGFPHTVSQSLVLLLMLFAVDHSNNREVDFSESGFSEEDLVGSILPFNITHFMTFIFARVRQGTYGLAEAGCPLPSPVLAELWYFLASMELLQPQQDCQSSEHCTLSRTFGVLHLYQAIWYGSRHAAGALATLREHGMFVPQHEKAAARLLHYSMLDTTNDILFQLLTKYGPKITRDYAATAVMAKKRSTADEDAEDEEEPLITLSFDNANQRDDVIPLNRLLRYERFFGWMGDGWYSVDHPYENHESLSNFLSLDDRESGDDDEEESKEYMKRDDYLLLKATVWLSGLHGVERDPVRAECRLLTILRHHGFVCDLQSELYGMHIDRDWDNVCHSHSKAMQAGHPAIPCMWHEEPRELPRGLDPTVYKTLQQTLFKLSFGYMVEQKFELSAFYAMIYMELSFTIYESAVGALKEDQGVDAERGTAPWYVEQLKSSVESDGYLPSYTKSPFATFKPLMLLSLARILAFSPTSKQTVDKMIRSTLYLGFGIEDDDEGPEVPLVRLFMCLIASSAEERYKGKSPEEVDFFDHNPNSIHDVDSFFSLVWLIRHMHRTEYPLSPPVLVARSLTYQALLGDAASTHLPLPSDDWVTYACRLSGLSTRIHKLASTSLMRQLGLPCRPPMLYQIETATGHLLDRTPTTFTLLHLRIEKQYHIRSPKTAPLWFAGDANMYIQGMGQTKFLKLWDRFLNFFYYLVTDTTLESLMRHFTDSIMPRTPTTSADEEDSGIHITSRSVFSAAFTSSREVRDLTIAILLLTNTLEIGMPQGFSLLFYTAEAGNNTFLAPLCDFLSLEMWGRVVLPMWREEHYVAQWHIEKPEIIRNGQRGTFSLDHHTPFHHAMQEVRQELMSRINRWTVRSIRSGRAQSRLPPSHQMQEKKEEQVKRELLLCSGYLTYLYYIETGRDGVQQYSQRGQIKHSPFSGSLLPAADVSCLQDLVWERDVTLTPEERRKFTADLHDAATRSRHYYKLSESTAGKETLLPSWKKFCDSAPPPAARAQEEEDEDDGVEPFFLVEPWAKEGEDSPSHLSLGEGRFFNQRLHRYTGASWAANVLWLRNWFWWLIGR